MRNQQATQVLFELSKAGRRATRMPASDVPIDAASGLMPTEHLASDPLLLPELAEPDVVRHFSNLSTMNMSVDTHFYPLGSCTMKHNPKRNERLAALPGFVHVHPYQSEASIQGLLQLLYEMQVMLAEIAGLPAVSLQPAAGAHGELTALMVAEAYFREVDEPRTRVLTPDSSHGTNPASARMVGFDTVTVKSTVAGYVNIDNLREHLDERTVAFMITNPNTLGLFDGQVEEIAELVHACGG